MTGLTKIHGGAALLAVFVALCGIVAPVSRCACCLPESGPGAQPPVRGDDCCTHRQESADDTSACPGSRESRFSKSRWHCQQGIALGTAEAVPPLLHHENTWARATSPVPAGGTPPLPGDPALCPGGDTFAPGSYLARCTLLL